MFTSDPSASRYDLLTSPVGNSMSTLKRSGSSSPASNLRNTQTAQTLVAPGPCSPSVRSEGNSSMISRARVRAHAEGVRPIGGRLRVSVPPSKLQGARRPSVTQRSPWIRFAPLAARVVAESLQNASVSPAESVRACPRFDTKRPLCRAARRKSCPGEESDLLAKLDDVLKSGWSIQALKACAFFV
jgi:hypothetical protein